MFVSVACRHRLARFGTAASSDALANRLKACFEFTELFRGRGAGQSPYVLKHIGTILEHFKGAWREFEGRRVYSQQRRCSFIRRAAAVDVDGDTGDVARRVRGEEEGEVGELEGFLSRLE